MKQDATHRKLTFIKDLRVAKTTLKKMDVRLFQGIFHELSDHLREVHQVYYNRIDHMTMIDQPLILISQIQRSGGTLLSQLFDGHSACYNHPHELYIGYPEKWNWPQFHLNDSPDVWFDMLLEERQEGFFYKGYKKYSGENKKQVSRKDIFPFLLPPGLQRKLFLMCANARDIRSQRDILNCYMTSYFNAWLDYQNMYGSQKKYVVGFTPRTNMFEDSVRHFFADYPDGKLISIIREPKGWYVSSQKHDPKKYPDPQQALPLWIKSAQMMLENKRQYGDQVYLMSFNHLVQNTLETMRALADFLDIPFEDILLHPTFQGMSIKADSSFKVDQYGVNREPVHRATQLDQDAAAFIDSQAAALFEEVESAVDSPMVDG